MLAHVNDGKTIWGNLLKHDSARRRYASRPSLLQAANRVLKALFPPKAKRGQSERSIARMSYRHAPCAIINLLYLTDKHNNPVLSKFLITTIVNFTNSLKNVTIASNN
jgi:hypothetical protein